MDNDQRNLSEQLQLLNELQYLDSDMPRSFRSDILTSNGRSRDTTRDVRILDTIAVTLTTGNPRPGEVFTAAFDKRKQMQLVLAKNGPPTLRLQGNLSLSFGVPYDAISRGLYRLLCPQRLWTNSTNIFLPSSVTGKDDKQCMYSR
jgi:hypothetical protein